MPAMRNVKIIALLLVALFLCVPRVALAQEPDQKAIGQDHPDVASTPSRNDPLEEALKINAEIEQLFNVGRYADAIPLVMERDRRPSAEEDRRSGIRRRALPRVVGCGRGGSQAPEFDGVALIGAARKQGRNGSAIFP